MFTTITQLLQKNRNRKLVFIVFCFSLLSLYPIYKNFYNGEAVTTYKRHIALIEGRSEYYNPWQYRMLCPVIIEGMMWTYNHTVDKIYPVEEKFRFQFTQTSEPTPETKEFFELLQTKGALKYLIVFVFFRFCLNFLVFISAFCLWRYFIKNNWLVFFALMFLSLAMGNGVIASDLTFNTYLDNVFYLLAACFIVYRVNPAWFIPLIILAAFNRETALLIPALYFVSQTGFEKFSLKKMNIRDINFPSKNVWLLTAVMYLIFLAIFVSVRLFYGYVTPQVWKVAPGLAMIKLNLISAVAAKAYFEIIGVLSVIPFIILYTFKRYPVLLRTWFITLVPLWFAVHIYSVVIYQARLFLVPDIIVFIPMLLWLIENNYSISDKKA
ncbi:MAG: hypothetical protein QM725_17165 [Lacibacter sp.]